MVISFLATIKFADSTYQAPLLPLLVWKDQKQVLHQLCSQQKYGTHTLSWGSDPSQWIWKIKFMLYLENSWIIRLVSSKCTKNLPCFWDNVVIGTNPLECSFSTILYYIVSDGSTTIRTWWLPWKSNRVLSGFANFRSIWFAWFLWKSKTMRLCFWEIWTAELQNKIKNIKMFQISIGWAWIAY